MCQVARADLKTTIEFLLRKMALQLCWYLFCLCFFVLYTSKAIKGSTRKLKSQEPIVLSDRLTLDLPPLNAGTASLLRSLREESSLNPQNCSVFNFSTVAVITRLGFSRNTVANFQWIGNPPYHVCTVNRCLLPVYCIVYTYFFSV